MTQYVQYDENGFIRASVISYGKAPECERQLAFDPPVDVTGKRVDLETGTLVDV